MAKVALLIGVSEYREGLKPLPAAPKDVAAMQEVLQNREMGGFDEVKTLVNPNHSEMAETIKLWFNARQSDDLVVLFFSGHGIKDESRELYFAACDTRKVGEMLIELTAVPASFVRSCLKRCKSKRQVVILDCCFSGAFGDLLAKDDGDVDLESQLGTEGGVVLTSSSSLQYSFEQQGSDLSIYTRYLVEGIRTGAADQDGDGAVSVDELHQFASKKVQAAAPAMTPKIIVLKELGYKIKLAKAPIGDAKLKYRKEVERRVHQGTFSIPARRLLKQLCNELGLSSDEADAIEAEVLQPYREHQRKLKEYEETLAAALQEENPLSERTRNDLRDYQKYLGLTDEDVKEIEQRQPQSTDTIFNVDEFLEEVKKIEQRQPQSTDTIFNVDEFLEEVKKIEQRQPHSTDTIPSRSEDETDDLSSDKGVDYTKLRDLLAQGKWKEADEETLAVMLKVAGRENEVWQRVEDIENCPCTDLRTIDTLWVKYSKGRFGFSVQKRIWESVGGTPDADYETYLRFGDHIKWRVNNDWLDYDHITFSAKAPEGHLPVKWLEDFDDGRGWYCGVSFSSLASRLVNCNI